MARKTDRKRLAKLEALYASLPRVACRGLCAVACGPIPLTEFEAERMARASRRLPMAHPDGTCGYLTPHERCSVYPLRPFICRVWGTLKRMSCIHGCIPDRWLTDHEFIRLGRAIEHLGGPISITSPDGVARGVSFFDFDLSNLPEDVADQLAERTRGLRALHGGRVIGLAPVEGAPEWINVDQDLPKPPE